MHVKETSSKGKGISNEITLADTFTDAVKDVIAGDENVLAKTTISEKKELEAILKNVNEEIWSKEIELHQDEEAIGLLKESNLDNENKETDEQIRETNSDK